MIVLFRIVEDEMPPTPEVTPELAHFLRLCFTKNPRARPKAADLFDHPWLRKYSSDRVCQCLLPFLSKLCPLVQVLLSNLSIDTHSFQARHGLLPFLSVYIDDADPRCGCLLIPACNSSPRLGPLHAPKQQQRSPTRCLTPLSGTAPTSRNPYNIVR
jgi:serine/threonine protein kinase